MKGWLLGVALVSSGVAQADEVFLTEAQAPAALFGLGASGQGSDVSLTDDELAVISRQLQKRVEQRGYRVVEVKGAMGEALGRIVILEVVGQSLPIQFAVGVQPNGSLQDVQVMVYREPYGKEINERRFRAQFRGKTARDPLVVGKDIDAISGASISSQSAAYAVRKALAIAGSLAARHGTK